MSWPPDLAADALAGRLRPHADDGVQLAALVRQARAAGLLGRVGQQVLVAVDGPVPPQDGASRGHRNAAAIAAHAEAAMRVSRAQHSEIRREVRFLQRALATLDAPVILLKGAAYVMAALPAAHGRVFSDIDLLVPKAALPQTESLLMLSGWMNTHHTPYDQRYYRQWMHELPPLQHLQRNTVVDVHHTILPETSRLRPDAARLIAASLPVPGVAGLRMLCPADMVLHSMTHLFMNDDMRHALRDLSDLDLLLRHFGDGGAGGPDFWQRLVEHAGWHQLRRPLFYGLRYTAQLLGTPVPASASHALRGAAPGPALLALMDAIWHRALRSPHPEAAPPGQAAALGALYLRGHWLRMPPVMLARHLTVKGLRLHERGHQNGTGGERKAAADAPR